MNIAKKAMVSAIFCGVLGGCTINSKQTKLNGSAERQPANTQALVDGAEKIFQDINNPNIFNANTCFQYVDSLTSTVFSLPSDYFFPKNPTEVETLKKQGPEIVQKLYNSRVALREKLQAFVQEQSYSSSCVNAVREGSQYLRYAEDFLIEWLVENDVVDSKPPEILETKFPHTLVNPKIQKLELQAGDVMTVRGKSYISAMISRIGDEEGNFSHLAIVAQDEKGKLYVAEALIHKGLIVTPLEKWRKDEDARVALYRYRDANVAQRAAREIYDHATSYINRGTTKRYDFAMDDSDSNAFFCSEVVSWSYNKATNGSLIVPQFRSETTKFANTDFFESLGIKRGSLFAPFDMEVDTRFDLLAEYRFLPLLRQVRMQDAVLQSMYSWMIKKDYDYFSAPNLSFKAMLGKVVRQFGFAADKLPTYMPYKTLLTTLKYEGVAVTLENNIYAKEREYYDRNGHSMTFKDLLEVNEEFRIQDCEMERAFVRASRQEKGYNNNTEIQTNNHKPSKFHWFFNNRKAANCVEM